MPSYPGHTRAITPPHPRLRHLSAPRTLSEVSHTHTLGRVTCRRTHPPLQHACASVCSHTDLHTCRHLTGTVSPVLTHSSLRVPTYAQPSTPASNSQDPLLGLPHQQPLGVRKKRVTSWAPGAVMNSTGPQPPYWVPALPQQSPRPKDREKKQVYEHLLCANIS